MLVVDDLLAGDAVAAAAGVLGTALDGPVPLAGSFRSAVLRCRRSDDGSTVIVKAYPRTPAGRHTCAQEAAGLAFSSPTGASPALLAADPAFPLLVMEDLGSRPSLADLLLDPAASGVRQVLADWALTCGRLAAWSTRPGGRAELARLYEGYAGTGGESGTGGLGNAVRSAPGMLGWAGVAVPAGLDAEVAALDEFVAEGGYPVFSPGDLCPDNNLITAEGVRLIDFESAGFHPVFLDAAYLRMPFSTCWCVLRLPAPVASSLEDAYRTSVCAAYPDLAADEVWQPGMRRATAIWTLHAMSYLLDRSLDADRSMNPDVAAAPTARALLRYRWQTLRDSLVAGNEFPALAEAMSGLLAATAHWPVPSLPTYPALT
jgi:hypothetical protein